MLFYLSWFFILLTLLQTSASPVLHQIDEDDLSYQDSEEFKRILQHKLDEHAKRGGNVYDRIVAVNQAHAQAKQHYQLQTRFQSPPISQYNTEDELIQINYKENDLGLYQGDVMLDPFEEELAHAGSHLRRRRSAVGSKKRLWVDRVIPYYIEASAQYAADVIRQAARIYNTRTCLTWAEISPSQANNINHVAFKKGAGCWSKIGRLYWKKARQEISVGEGCNALGTMLHEMMHAIGFWHEQARTDRDSYVKILWENILPGQEDQFDKQSRETVDTLDLQYDYKSIMHYGKTSFTRNGKNTIESIQSPSPATLGGEEFTELDVQKINVLYHCSSGVQNGWSPWGAWSACNPSGCMRMRERLCLSAQWRQAKDCPGARDYYGVERQRDKCANCPYPVPGSWNRWSSWSDCSVKCGSGTRTRTRKCDNPPPLNGGKGCAGTATESGTCYQGRCQKGAYDYEFEGGWAGWTTKTTSRYAKWQLQSGPTNYWSTGPSADHTTGKGTFALMETSWGSAGETAQLWSPLLPPTTYSCLTFWYNMRGANMGSLWVYVEPVGRAKWIKWFKKGEQGEHWINAAVTIEMPNERYKIMFEGKIGEKQKSGGSDIGVDDVYLDPGQCPNTCEDASDKPCETWAKQGECKKSAAYMSTSCCASCKKYKNKPDVITPGVCEDKDKRCSFWARKGECEKNEAYMKQSCCASCKKIKDKPDEIKTGPCRDLQKLCSFWAKKGECVKNPNYMLKLCCASCEAESCVDESVECPGWAQAGECDKNPMYMETSCRLSCKAC